MPQTQAAALPRHEEEEETQNHTSANRTNLRKALRLALYFPSEVIAMLRDHRLRTVSRINHHGFKALLRPANFTLGPDATLSKEIITRAPRWPCIAHLITRQVCHLAFRFKRNSILSFKLAAILNFQSERFYLLLIHKSPRYFQWTLNQLP